MRVDLFDFHLPAERIAQTPVQPRDAARLLVVAERREDRIVRDLPDLLLPGDLLVLNDTRVLPTRFAARRGDVPVEVTLVEPAGGAAWWALARPGKRLRLGDRVELAADLDAEVLAKRPDGAVLLGFALTPAELGARIEHRGTMPLPPYIRRPPGGSPDDRRDYQSIFARIDGSVAAPTASLHLTRDVVDRLDARGIARAFITLHVGLGTFAPVKVSDTEAHTMHPERFAVPPGTATAVARTRAAGGRIVAVGTTVLRALETAARDDGSVRAGPDETRLFCTPGFRFRVVDRLMTNFHLPRSTLFMLVCAFAGTARMHAAYAHAIARGYRFYSYGDACLLDRAQAP